MKQKYQLRNGMKVLLIESKKSPVVSVQAWVRTGSADERKGEEGLSHFIEHLVFKGTRKFKVGEIAAAIESAGGELNAYTSFDQTVFHVTLSKHFLDTGLDVISEMTVHPLFDEKEIDAEREVVLEEIKKTFDEPGRQSSRVLFETVYKKHPYRLPVIGFDRVIRSVSKKKILEYFHSRYVPANMTLVVAGDFDKKEIKAAIRDRFETAQPFKLRKVVRKKEPAQKTPRIKAKKSSFEEAQLNVAWRVPFPGHEIIPALEVLGLILGQGESSRLLKAARIDRAIVNSVGSGLYTLKDGGLFVIMASLNAAKINDYLEVLEEELSKILSEPPSAEEIQKAITNFESDEFYSLETVDNLAKKAGYYEDLMGDSEYFQKFMKRVSAIKPADIVKCARKFLSPKTMSVTFMDTSGNAGSTARLKRFQKSFAKIHKEAGKVKINTRVKGKKKAAFKWERVNVEDRPPEKLVLPGGITLLLKQNFETPTISARAAFAGGARLEPEAKEGLVELLSNTWLSGAGKFSEQEIYSETESIATSLSAFGGRNTIGLTLDTLAPFEARALEILTEVLSRPHFPESAVARERDQLLEAARLKEDYPAQLAIQMFHEGLFGAHPYSRDLGGTLKSIPTLSVEDIKQYWSKVATARNLTISVSGHFNMAAWKAALEGVGKDLSLGQRLTNSFEHMEIRSPISLYRKLDKEQSHVVLGYKGLTQKDPRRFALQVMQSVLAGQGGRLFVELRDKASLAYSVAPIKFDGIDTGYFAGYIACSPSKVEVAIKMLRDEFVRLAENRISDAELERAKRFVSGRHDIDLQRNSSICAAMLFDDIYGRPFDESFHFSEIVNGVTAEDVQSLAKEIFSQSGVLSVVGPNPPKTNEYRPARKEAEPTL